MTDLMPREPLAELRAMREAMQRLFEEAFLRPFAPSLLEGLLSRVLPLDLYQTPDEVVVKATLPGVQPEDVEVSVVGNVLTIRGEAKAERQAEGATYYLRERRFGTFSRSVVLPAEVDVDRAEAVFENGVLTLTLPKSEQAKPKTITIKARKK